MSWKFYSLICSLNSVLFTFYYKPVCVWIERLGKEEGTKKPIIPVWCGKCSEGEDGENGQSWGNFPRIAIPEDFYETLASGDLISGDFMKLRIKKRKKEKKKRKNLRGRQKEEASFCFLKTSNIALHKIWAIFPGFLKVHPRRMAKKLFPSITVTECLVWQYNASSPHSESQNSDSHILSLPLTLTTWELLGEKPGTCGSHHKRSCPRREVLTRWRHMTLSVIS